MEQRINEGIFEKFDALYVLETRTLIGKTFVTSLGIVTKVVKADDVYLDLFTFFVSKEEDIYGDIYEYDKYTLQHSRCNLEELGRRIMGQTNCNKNHQVGIILNGELEHYIHKSKAGITLSEGDMFCIPKNVKLILPSYLSVSHDKIKSQLELVNAKHLSFCDKMVSLCQGIPSL